MPKYACDCHCHVFGPQDRYPYSEDRTFTPPDASLEDLLRLQHVLGLERAVIVQPSVYGADNRSLIDMLGRLGDRARGIAGFNAETTNDELVRLDAAGVRGVRLNLEAHGDNDAVAARERLQLMADRVGPFGWHVQIWTNVDVIAKLRPTIEKNPHTTFVFDHFGRCDASRWREQPGFRDLLELVRDGRVYVKVSAPHRISNAPDYADVGDIVHALVDANPERLVWGSDWPHREKPRNSKLTPFDIEPLRREDDGAALNRLNRWVASPRTMALILAENPARLYGFPAA
nr:amidohydrolase family protein [Propylenella binzhouense]